MLMAEIRLGGIHKGLHGNASHAFNIGELTNEERIELIRKYEELHGAGTLKISASIRQDVPIPDVKQPPKNGGLPNGDFSQYQYELEKEVLALANEIRQDSKLKKYGNP